VVRICRGIKERLTGVMPILGAQESRSRAQIRGRRQANRGWVRPPLHKVPPPRLDGSIGSAGSWERSHGRAIETPADARAVTLIFPEHSLRRRFWQYDAELLMEAAQSGKREAAGAPQGRRATGPALSF
jgi:hypothetical protein